MDFFDIGDDTGVDCCVSCTSCASCSDFVQNGDETDVDCGGSCSDCANRLICDVDDDCLSDFCFDGICQLLTCYDGLLNGDEGDVDCGGSCILSCVDPLPPACDDDIQNGDETGVDCGGSCDPCLIVDPDPFLCNDGYDNDNDGDIDYPADDGCESLTDDDESDDPVISPPTPPPGPVAPACSDGVDNDGDFKIDFPADVGCESPSDNNEFNAKTTIATCVDTDDLTGEEAKGTVSGNFFGNPYGPIEDTCWGIYVKEYYCQEAPYGSVGGLNTFKYRLCTSGCSDGACN